MQSGTNKKKGTSPSLGEKAAITGFEPQYALAADFAFQAARNGRLESIRLIDPNAGIADDFQIVTSNRVDAFQVKWNDIPKAMTYATFKEMLEDLAKSWVSLKEENPNKKVVISLATNGPASTNDKIDDANKNRIGTFYEFCKEILNATGDGGEIDANLRAKWNAPLEDLRQKTSLSKSQFGDFIRNMYIAFDIKLASEQQGMYAGQTRVDGLGEIESVKAYLR